MLYEYSGVCQNCAEEISVTIHNGQPLDSCSKCHSSPFDIKAYKGLVYVVSNPNQPGVKIGMSERTLEQRIKSLNSTGVVGKFQPIVIFPSDNPKKDEKKVHDKLVKKNISKEHFDLSPVDAALKCYRILNKRKPIFYNKDIEDTFWLRLEQDKIAMKLKLKGKIQL